MVLLLGNYGLALGGTAPTQLADCRSGTFMPCLVVCCSSVSTRHCVWHGLVDLRIRLKDVAYLVALLGLMLMHRAGSLLVRSGRRWKGLPRWVPLWLTT